MPAIASTGAMLLTGHKGTSGKSVENWPLLVNERNGDLSPSASLASHTLESGGCMQV
jgi:hypothetical protein